MNCHQFWCKLMVTICVSYLKGYYEFVFQALYFHSIQLAVASSHSDITHM